MMPASISRAVYLGGFTCLLLLVTLCSGGPIEEDHTGHRSKRSASPPSIASRKACTAGDEQPATRENTTQRLADLRTAMAALTPPADAFIVLSDDAHGSEYPAESDKRRGYISGFTGSAGIAVVTKTKAALWTDGRYFLEAEDALDCNWIFMKSGLTGVPSITQWLVSELNANNVVSADPFLIPNSLWLRYEKALAKKNITMVAVPSGQNPVDTAWGSTKPPPPMTNVSVLELKYAGKSWEDKVTELRNDMVAQNFYGAFIVTSLDEVAWLFNLRASDISYNPFLLAYAIVEVSETGTNRTRLFMYNKDRRLPMPPSDPESNKTLKKHFNTGNTGSCQGMQGMCVEVLDYNPTEVLNAVKDLTGMVWVTYLCNYAIYGSIPQDKLKQERSIIALTKAQKNAVEREGMTRCHKRDSAVLIEFLAKLEKSVKANDRQWTELSAAKELKSMRMAADLNRGLSFNSISGSGPNGAVIHYSVTNATDRNINTMDMYLLDSGGQYLDGTTDVTRTMHFGKPTPYEKECYTRVLMGAVDLALMIWPEGLYGREIDMAARAPLWSVGLEYRHGTGHGIGAFLSVHEGPARLSMYHPVTVNDEPVYPYMFFSDGPGFIGLSKSPFYSQERLLPGMFFSDEPGFYEDGKFGIRLETIVMVEPTNTTHKFGDKQFLKFKPITLVPFEPNLIDYSLLSERQITWVNEYHRLCKVHIEPLLKTQVAKDWLRARTEPYERPTPTSSASRPFIAMAAVIVATVATFTSLQWL